MFCNILNQPPQVAWSGHHSFYRNKETILEDLFSTLKYRGASASLQHTIYSTLKTPETLARRVRTVPSNFCRDRHDLSRTFRINFDRETRAFAFCVYFFTLTNKSVRCFLKPFICYMGQKLS